jgi:hypothetical protein
MTDESTDNPSMSGSAAVVRGPRWEQRRGCAAGRWFDWAGGDSVPRSQLPWFQKFALSSAGRGFCAWSVSGQVATSSLYVVSAPCCRDCQRLRGKETGFSRAPGVM